jgi:hypothetical protein
MRCKDCGHEMSMNKICERPIQAATDMLNMAAHNASRAFATVERDMRPQPEAISSDELSSTALGIPATGNRFGFPAQLSL